MLIVNGKKSDGKLFETDGKIVLIEEVQSPRGTDCIDARQLYEREGQLARTKKATRVEIEDLPMFIEELIAISGIPFELCEVE